MILGPRVKCNVYTSLRRFIMISIYNSNCCVVAGFMLFTILDHVHSEEDQNVVHVQSWWLYKTWTGGRWSQGLVSRTTLVLDLVHCTMIQRDQLSTQLTTHGCTMVLMPTVSVFINVCINVIVLRMLTLSFNRDDDNQNLFRPDYYMFYHVLHTWIS